MLFEWGAWGILLQLVFDGRASGFDRGAAISRRL
jgi:hypothetical protein